MVEILSALLTPLIPIFMAFIAYQQWLTNEKKRKQDLFDKRWNLYKRIKQQFNKLISSHIAKMICIVDENGKSKLSGEEQKQDFYAEMLKKINEHITFAELQEEVYFLFGEDISDLLKELEKKEKWQEYLKHLAAGTTDIDFFEIYFKDLFSKYLCIEPSKKSKLKNIENE